MRCEVIACFVMALVGSWAFGAEVPAELKPAADDDLARPVLANTSAWRWHAAWRKAAVVTEPGSRPDAPATPPQLLKPGLSFGDMPDTERIETPPPPAGWTKPDFDDFDWPRGPLPVAVGGSHMGPIHISVGLLSVRGKFIVDDPKAVTGLHLSLGYRGGAVVYLNGREVARCDLPAGRISPATPGNPYPEEAWMDAAGQPLPRVTKMTPEQKARAAARDRRSGPVRLPVDALRKGVNVLAVEVHRSDFHPIAQTWWNTRDFMYGGFSGWVPLGLDEVALLATGSGYTPNLSGPAGLEVWALDVMDRLDKVDFPDPRNAAQPIVVSAVRNGEFSGALAISSNEAFGNARVSVTDLAKKGGGATIPSSAVRIDYVLKARLPETGGNVLAFDVMAEAPPAEVAVEKRGSAVLPVWLTARVPKSAAPGDYEGRVTVAVEGQQPVEIPLTVSVAGWTLPDPQAFRTVVSIYQSPTTLALHYQVPEWSEKHWQLMERSFALLAPFGVDLVNVPIVDQTQFGNDDGMVHWLRKPDGSFDYDFTVFDRYIQLVKRHLGAPRFISLQVWHGRGYDEKDAVRQKNTVTVIDPVTGSREHLQVPAFGTEESREFWTPVLTAIKARLAKEGLEKSLCLGILSDGTGPAEMHKMFAGILPGIGWTRGCHFHTYATAPTPLPGGGAIVCHEYCYATVIQDPSKAIPRIWDYPTRPGLSYFRDERDFDALFHLRTMAQRALCGNTRGIGRICLDYWSLKQERPGRTRAETVFNRWPHSSCAQRQPTVWGLASPGPDGAVKTIRLQALLEGVQEAEALIFVTEAMDTKADRLGPDLTERCRAFFIETIQNGRQDRYAPGNCGGWRNRTARLWALAAEVAERTAGG